jgi:small subunit ribosomal protein S2
LRCIQVIAGVLGRAGEQGQKLRLKAAEQGVVTYTPAADLKPPTTNSSVASQLQQSIAKRREEAAREGALPNSDLITQVIRMEDYDDLEEFEDMDPEALRELAELEALANAGKPPSP